MNGWKNYVTWNVALWIQNDEGLYRDARPCDTYEQFLIARELFGESTPDGVSWNDSGLDIEALDEMIAEL